MAIFVSYSHKNKEFVDRLCRNLISEKIHLWMDRWELKPGDSLMDSIQMALEHAGAILVVLSKSYIESNWCKKEMNAGLIRELEKKGNVIIPIIIEDCDVPIFLREKMYADFRKDFDDAYRILAEALAKYTNLDQGRFDIPDFHVDYSSEYISTDGDIVGLRYQFVEHAENRPFSVLSILHIIFNDRWQKRYSEFVNAGHEMVARSVITLILIDFLGNNEIKFALKDASAQRRKIEVVDTKNGASVMLDFEVRWMGEDTGKTIIYWAGNSIKGALKQFMANVKPFSDSEKEEIFELINKPI